ncbi:MAG: DUF2855 family protein [Rhodospirillales bacterium]|nr:DUF2855 family protein [Rhodospirillales bacterium]
MTAYDFKVRKDNIGTCEIAPATELDDLTPQAGEIIVKIDRFALTANNVTYAAIGDMFSYWDYFPAADGWGRVPVWGFADVVTSNCDGISEGERLYGYFPMSSYLVMTPIKITDHGFQDGTEHRLKLHAVYNGYSRCAADPVYSKANEDYEMLLRPLFMTSFLIDDYFADNDFFGGNSVILSSASSKTALGTAFLLKRNRSDSCKVIGLTSPGNKGFVTGLGVYDEVVVYDDISEMDNTSPAVYIDFAGSKEVRSAIHERFGDQLKFSSMIGASHWDQQGMSKAMPGPKPILFFAPDQIKKRNKDWGPQGVMQRFGASWKAFLEPLNDWISVSHTQGGDAIKSAYLETLAGKVKPSQGLVLSP